METQMKGNLICMLKEIREENDHIVSRAKENDSRCPQNLITGSLLLGLGDILQPKASRQKAKEATVVIGSGDRKDVESCSSAWPLTYYY